MIKKLADAQESMVNECLSLEKLRKKVEALGFVLATLSQESVLESTGGRVHFEGMRALLSDCLDMLRLDIEELSGEIQSDLMIIFGKSYAEIKGAVSPDHPDQQRHTSS